MKNFITFFFLLSSAYAETLYLINNLQYESISDPTNFIFTREARYPIGILAFFDYNDDDVLQYSYDRNCQYDPNCVLENVPFSETKGLFFIKQSFFAKTDADYKVRYGTIDSTQCPDGIYITNDPSLDFGKYMNSPGFTEGETHCLIFLCKKCTATIANTLPQTDNLTFMQNYIFTEIPYMRTKNVSSSDTFPIFLRMTKGPDQSQRDCPVTITYRDGAPPDQEDIIDVNTNDYNQYPPIGGTESSSEEETSSTPDEIESSSEEQLDEKQSEEIIPPEEMSTSSSNEYQTLASSTESHNNPTIITATPEPTWDGQWADEGIIRGDDIPEIKETHPPLQTEYVRTPIPVVTTVTSISIGVIFAIIVIVISIVNFVRSYRTVKDAQNPISTARYETSDDGSSDDFIGLSESDISDEYVTDSDAQDGIRSQTNDPPKQVHFVDP